MRTPARVELLNPWIALEKEQAYISPVSDKLSKHI